MAAVALSRFDRVGAGLWILLGSAALIFGAREFLTWGATGSVKALAALGFVCVFTGLAVVMSWRVGRWLGGVGGALLTLYAIALVLLGTEDVGGLHVSLPAGILMAAFGVWNIVAAAGRA